VPYVVDLFMVYLSLLHAKKGVESECLLDHMADTCVTNAYRKP
jgi:hypothetical protein